MDIKTQKIVSVTQAEQVAVELVAAKIAFMYTWSEAGHSFTVMEKDAKFLESATAFTK